MVCANLKVGTKKVGSELSYKCHNSKELSASSAVSSFGFAQSTAGISHYTFLTFPYLQ